DRDRQSEDRTARGLDHKTKASRPPYLRAVQPLMVVVLLRDKLDDRRDVAGGKHADHRAHHVLPTRAHGPDRGLAERHHADNRGKPEGDRAAGLLGGYHGRQVELVRLHPGRPHQHGRRPVHSPAAVPAKLPEVARARGMTSRSTPHPPAACLPTVPRSCEQSIATIAVVTRANVLQATMFWRRVFFRLPLNVVSWASRKTKNRITGTRRPFRTCIPTSQRITGRPGTRAAAAPMTINTVKRPKKVPALRKSRSTPFRNPNASPSA